MYISSVIASTFTFTVFQTTFFSRFCCHEFENRVIVEDFFSCIINSLKFHPKLFWSFALQNRCKIIGFANCKNHTLLKYIRELKNHLMI